MLDLNSKVIDIEEKNKIIYKTINLDKNLDLFILADCKDSDACDLIVGKIIDFAIDNITLENTYKDFALLLENTNSILKTLRQNNDKDFSIIIGILNKNNLFFSNIGKTSVYLIKTTNEVIEVTEKDENKKDFLFISEGKIDHLDTIVFATDRLLNYLSYSDFSDSVIGKKAEEINKNIESIVKEEKLDKNIGILTFKYYFLLDNNKTSSLKIKDFFNTLSMKALDNVFVKKIIAYYLLGKEKLKKQSKTIQNGFYLTIIALSILALYFIINGIVTSTTNTKTIEVNKENLTKALEYVRIASNNSNNSEIFNLNIKKAEEIAKDLKNKNLFLNDVNNLLNDINIIKKQFNGIETYNINNSNLLYKIEEKNPIKLTKINRKTYLITKNLVIGPIIPGKKPKKYNFTNLKDDYFIDAAPLDNSIILITKLGKVVEFTKNGYFLYKDVEGQKTWEKSNTILSYANNIYLLSEQKNQIFKHKKIGKTFQKAIAYLKPDDVKAIGKIIDIAIDGGIYILKDDLSIVKFFSTPYRLEKIVINKLPDNYKKESNSPIKIKTRKDLNYVYILLNDKIWIFKPNTRRFQDTKSLTYLGQIEASNGKIKEFYVNHDGDIDVLTNTGIYKLNFEVNDGKIIVR